MKKRSSSWSEFLKARREAKFRSAREFCAKRDIGISYPQYSRYESGEQLPSLDQALDICRNLDVPPLETLLEWSRSQSIPEDERSLIDGLLSQVKKESSSDALVAQAPAVEFAAHAPSKSPGTLSRAPFSLEDVIVFNRTHLKMFLSDPLYRDIFVYVNSYSPEWIRIEEVAQAMKVDVERAEKMIEDLFDLGVVLTAGGKCRAVKNNFYFPDDADFFPLRNQNFRHNVDTILGGLSHEDLKANRAYRNLITRELSSDQLKALQQRLDDVVQEVIEYPDVHQDDRIYSVCLLVGERFGRAQLDGTVAGEGLQLGLKTELSSPESEDSEASEN